MKRSRQTLALSCLIVAASSPARAQVVPNAPGTIVVNSAPTGYAFQQAPVPSIPVIVSDRPAGPVIVTNQVITRSAPAVVVATATAPVVVTRSVVVVPTRRELRRQARYETLRPTYQASDGITFSNYSDRYYPRTIYERPNLPKPGGPVPTFYTVYPR